MSLVHCKIKESSHPEELSSCGANDISCCISVSFQVFPQELITVKTLDHKNSTVSGLIKTEYFY